MFLPGEISSGFMNTFSSRGSSPLPPTPRWINTILFRDPSDANVRQTTCAKSEVEIKPKQPAGCGAVCPVPLACRKPEEAQEPRQVPALCCQPMQGQEFDFQTAPHCWKLGKRDVLNKYPKYFLAPLGFFFFFNRKTAYNFGISFTIYRNTAILESSREEDNTYTNSILLLQA